MPVYRCSQVVDTVIVDGVKTPIPCGKLALRRMREHPGYDAGHWLDGCCEDCVAGLRNDVGLTEAEINLLYPLCGDAVRFAQGTK